MCAKIDRLELRLHDEREPPLPGRLLVCRIARRRRAHAARVVRELLRCPVRERDREPDLAALSLEGDAGLARLDHVDEVAVADDRCHAAAALVMSAETNLQAVQRMPGNASAAMTLDTYVGLFDDDPEHVADVLDRGTKCGSPPESFAHTRPDPAGSFRGGGKRRSTNTSVRE
ncbi:hypothetical protein [Leucobacter iarius]|uniref:Uncharacterized protein n=1 Tax=Leucobacter iarius TaxID=333963 RepID=A0ABP4XPG5_9MICO